MTGAAESRDKPDAAPLPAMRAADLLLDGQRIEAGWWGMPPEAAPSLVLLHEGLGSLRLWGGFPALLARTSGFGVFAFSRFGYGASDPVPLPRPLDFMEREARDVLPRVLDAAGLRRCLLVGHSDGASIAAIAAGMQRDARLAGLVLIAPHFFVEDVSIAAIAAARDAYAAGDLRARLAAHHADVEVAFRGWNDTWLDPAFRSWDITRYLPAIRVPALLIQGEADPYGTVAHIRAAERLLSAPVRTLLLPGIGHDPAREARPAAVEAIASFAR
ncbi:MAG: alpha/beta fold hydrolase, partial [Acetobacteraceae bacterium]